MKELKKTIDSINEECITDTKEIIVSQDGIRLDAYIAKKENNLSRSMIQKLIYW